MESNNRQYEHAFTMMTLDIVENVLKRPENLSQVTSHLMAKIRELSGARTIIMFQYLQEKTGTYTHRLLGVNPERTRAIADTADIVRLIEIIHDLPGSSLWRPRAQGTESESILDRLGYGLSLALPLHAGSIKVGAILILGLPDDHHVDSIVNMQETLSGILALVLRNSFLIETQRENIANLKRAEDELREHRDHLKELVNERTQDLERINEELQVEISERKRAEAELQKAHDDLEAKVSERTGELEQANVRLLDLDRMKSMFIASMSHELRTPLNSIMGFTGVILDGISGEINDKQKDQLIRVHRSAQHLLAVITDIIDISRVESGKLTVTPEEFFLGELVNEAIDNINELLYKEGLAIEVTVPSGLKVLTDRNRLFQCILNFLSNAVKYSEAGTIKVDAKEINGEVEISISDTGIGIPKKDLPKIFHSFERLDSRLRVKAGGTGLGLYLTKKIITELLGGKIEVESEEGKGSTFRLKFPKNIKTNSISGNS